MTTEKTTQDIYQQITDRVVAAIEAGAPTFEMPWHRGAQHPRPSNVATGEVLSRGEYPGPLDRPIHTRLGVAACNRNTLDLQSKVFSTCNQQD